MASFVFLDLLPWADLAIVFHVKYSMITRLYVNNFRCLVAFEMKFDSFQVLCGPNGAGKSSVFDALRLIRNLGSGEGILGGDGERDVPQLDFTNWQEATIQEFELDLVIEGKFFSYVLHLEQVSSDLKPRIILEKGTCDGKVIFEREFENVRLPRNDGSEATFPLDWRNSALAAIQAHKEEVPVNILKNAISRILILRPSPRVIEEDSKSEVKQPDLKMSNLISWYRSLYQDQEWTDSLRELLQEIWPDFRSFRMVDVGLNTKTLQLKFVGESHSAELFLHQLSDGEKALVGLYMLRATLGEGKVKTILVDEPDNYVGLQELQPWVYAMRELLDEEHQCLLISHHPEILVSSGPENGRYLWRDHHAAPTRVGPLKIPAEISPGEATARGWIHA